MSLKDRSPDRTRHQEVIEAYLDRREYLAETVRKKLSEVQPYLSLIRSRLLAQQK